VCCARGARLIDNHVASSLITFRLFEGASKSDLVNVAPSATFI